MTDNYFSKEVFNQLKYGNPIKKDNVDFSISLKPASLKFLLGKMDKLKNKIHQNAKNY